MLNPYQLNCIVCNKLIGENESRVQHNGDIFCGPCYTMSREVGRKLEQAFNKETETTKEFNEPAHYHKHNIDTIKFLQEGFPPEVFMGFAIGHIIKYAQRANYKNGREDFIKMVDYSKRALDWYDKTHS
jgi:hypothetical protein